jgi:pSer/pThr/pTyr-binding forkhead associated (FHA) protein
MWILRSSEADGSLTFRLPNGTSRTMGRGPRADFIVEAALVSRVHCRVTGGNETLDVEDLSSTNGVFINDTRVEKGHLTNGDRLRIGRLELAVEQVSH